MSFSCQPKEGVAFQGDSPTYKEIKKYSKFSGALCLIKKVI